MVFKFSLAVIALLVLSGCVPQTHHMQTSFNAREHLPYTKSGSATVAGQAFLKRNDGQVVTCAGSSVRLMPDTPFVREVISAVSARKVADPNEMNDAKAKLKAAGAKGTMMRDSVCDAQGNFSFKGLPAGRWVVLTEVLWMAQYTQGGVLIKNVTTSSGKISEVILTSRDAL